MRRAVVAGLGQPAAGDDGVGLAVLDELERRGAGSRARLVRLRDPLDLVTHLESADLVVLVDAVLGTPPGSVVDLGLSDLSRSAPLPVSSHGIGVVRAVELARALGAAPSVRVAAVVIERPGRFQVGLSPPVAAAVPIAADRVERLLR